MDDAIVRVPVDVADDHDAAFNGTNYLVTWTDNRTGARRLYASRVTPAVGPLDGEGVRLSASRTSAIGNVRVASNGQDFLVVWTEGSGASMQILARRFAANGSLPELAPFQIAQDNATGLDVVWSGAEYTVAWSSSSFRTARVTSAGAVLDAGGKSVSSEAATANLSLASDGTHTLVAVGTVEFLLDAQGDLVAGSKHTVGSTSSVVWIGDRYVIATEANNTVYGTRVDAAGNLIDATPLQLAAQRSKAQLASDGDGFLLVTFPNYVFARRYGSDLKTGPGVELGLAPPTKSLRMPAVAGGADGYLAVTHDANVDGTLGHAVSAGGFITKIATITNPASLQLDPAIAAGPTENYVLWRDRRFRPSPLPPTSKAHYARGALLDAGAQPAASAELLADYVVDLHVVGAAYAQDKFLVLWDYDDTNSPEVRGRLIGTDGTKSAVFNVSAPANPEDTTESSPVVASSGTDFLAVWTTVDPYSVRGRRVSPTGTMSSEFTIGAAAVGGYPSVAWDGERYLAIWSRRLLGQTEISIYGSFVNSDGSVAQADIPLLTGSEAWMPHVAGAGEDRWLIAWIEQAEDPWSLKVATFDGTTLGSPKSIKADVSRLALVWGGRQYLLAYQFYNPVTTSEDIEIRRLDVTGELVGDPLPFPQEPIDETAPALSTIGHERYVLAYSKYDSALGGMRVVTRTITHLLENGDACADALDCESEFCVDGVCCNSACGGGSDSDCRACSQAAGAVEDGECADTTGNACKSDDLCLVSPTCNAGECGGEPVVCEAADACHAPGECDSESGVCSTPALEDGTACDLDGESGACLDGECTASGDTGAGGQAGVPIDGGAPGEPGTGGEPSSGGTGSGGDGGSAGTLTAGGTSGDGAGASGGESGSGTPSDSESDSSSGCGCRLDGRAQGSWHWAASASLALLVARRRRSRGSAGALLR